MAGMRKNGLIEALVRGFSSRKPIRTGSLITSLYGDMVAPRGGTVWLGSLLPLLQDFGINDSQARTAMSRLVEDNWLQANRVGRKSYYSLTETGRARFDEATRRIYSGPPHDWSGDFCLVITPGGASPERDRVRKELGWIGFGSLSPGAFIHPDPDEEVLNSVLSRLAPKDRRPIVIRGASQSPNGAEVLRHLVDDCWALDKLAADYDQFTVRFEPLRQDLRSGIPLQNWECALARVMLIHEYRRVILRDPLLPPQLLPSNWSGTQARELALDIYERIAEPSEAWISVNFEREDGELPPPNPAFWQRFGGLPQRLVKASDVIFK